MYILISFIQFKTSNKKNDHSDEIIYVTLKVEHMDTEYDIEYFYNCILHLITYI